MAVKEPIPTINFAASSNKSNALGPGDRAVLWVRGCERHCKGCISPYWWSKTPETLISAEELAHRLLIDQPQIRGITISGGEPFLQAPGLATLLRNARNEREFDTIIYSGYTLQGLKESGLPGIQELLGEVDVLIDGEYRFDLPANDGIRGSTNQIIHFLTGRIQPQEFYGKRNPLELHTKDGHAFMIGVPSKKQLAAFNQSVNELIDRFHLQTVPSTQRSVLHEL